MIDYYKKIYDAVNPKQLRIEERKKQCEICIPYEGNKYKIRGVRNLFPMCISDRRECLIGGRELYVDIDPEYFTVDYDPMNECKIILIEETPRHNGGSWKIKILAKGIKIRGSVSIYNTYGHLCKRRKDVNESRDYTMKLVSIITDYMGIDEEA